MPSYSDKPWLKHYDPGIPTSLMPYPQVPLFHFLHEAARTHPQTPALLTSARLPLVGRLKATVSYAELDRQSDALAAALGHLGVHKGDCVAVIMPNCVQFAVSFWGILKAGGVVCAVNPSYPELKIQHQLQSCGARLCIVLSKFYDAVKHIQKDTSVAQILVTNIKEYLPPLASTLFTIAREKKEGHRADIQPGDQWFSEVLRQFDGQKSSVEVSAADLALYQYTGGTTGVPKAAMATHQALVCNAMQIVSWLGVHQEPQRMVGALPMFHVFGMVAVLVTAVKLCAPILLVPDPRDINELLDVLHAYKPTLFPGVPAMYNAINNHPDVIAGKYDLKSITACISGSAPLPPVTKQKFEQITGGKLVEGYGMSEMPTASHVNPLFGENRAGSIGLPVPDMEMCIVKIEDGNVEVPVGEVGELVMWGPQIMSGYLNQPAETEISLRLRPDGKKWLYTGDIAYMDQDGYVYVVDRKKDMAIIGGYNVYPRNVEDVLLEHPAVSDVGVAAIPHPNPEKAGQEALKAWIVLKPGNQCLADDLITFATTRLARYEVPTRIAFVNELPKSMVGKVLRRELVQMELAARGIAESRSTSPSRSTIQLERN